jgi:hypothetical protein
VESGFNKTTNNSYSKVSNFSFALSFKVAHRPALFVTIKIIAFIADTRIDSDWRLQQKISM